MKIKAWLERHVPGFANLNEEEREAMSDFSLLWSLFEHEVLSDNANAQAIIGAVAGIRNQRPINLGLFQEPLSYFRQRYYDGQAFRQPFEGLRLRGNDNKPLVEKVMANET